jgi:ribosome biogenesis protein Nip4
MLGLVDSTTGQQAADIQQSYLNQASTTNQNLAKLGMSGTTVGSSLQSGINRSKSAALNALADTMSREKLAIMQNKEKASAYAPSTDLIKSLVGTSAGNTYTAGTAAEALGKLSM